MIKKFKSVVKTDLIRISFFTSIATFFRIVSAFVLNKIVAAYVGPVGVALVGQFNNFYGIIATIGNGSIGTGVVKYIAEDRSNDVDNRKIISTAFSVTIFCSFITGLVVLLFAGYFSDLIFNSQEYKYIIILSAASLIFTSFNTLLVSALVGDKEIAKYTWTNIIARVLTMALAILMVMNYKLQGILIVLVAMQLLEFFVILPFVLKSHWFKINYFFHHFDKIILKKLSNYSIMTLVASFMGPVTTLVIRNYIGSNLSWKEAGYWQGVWSISDVYLLFITSALNIYYMPRLSEISDKKELRIEIIKTSKIILPVITAMALIIFLAKSLLVNILFTNEFKPMLPLFKYQLTGDVIKIASWMISIQMLAKAMTKLFIITEIMLNASLVILSLLFIRYFGLEGAPMAFSLNCFLYLLYMIFIFRKSLFLSRMNVE